MRVRILRMAAALTTIVSCICTTTYAQVSTNPPGGENSPAAQPSLTPPTPQQIAQARHALAAEIPPFERFLTRSGKSGPGWKAFLLWPDLRQQLAPHVQPNLETLKKVQRQFDADQAGLEMPGFTRVAQALRRYIDLLELAGTQDYATHMGKRVEALQAELDAYRKQPGEELSASIGRRLGELDRVAELRPLVKSIRQKNSYLNLYAEASGHLIGAGIERAINDNAAIRDVILGTNVSGIGHTVGRVEVELAPNPRYALFEAVLNGTTYSRTVGRNGPATIHSNGVTSLRGSKRIAFDVGGLIAFPAAASANTCTKITSINADNGRLGGRLVQRIATKRVYEGKAEAERVGSRHAAQRVRERLEAETNSRLATSNRDYLTKFRNPLLRRREFPSYLHFSTSRDYLNVASLQANPFQIGAPDAPPSITAQHDLAVRVHESMINNLASSFLSGVKLTDTEVRKRIIEARGSLPDRFKGNEDEEEWSITFADRRPVIVTFADDGFGITIRGKRYTSGDRKFKDADVTARYKIQREGNQVVLLRQGEMQIEPPTDVEKIERDRLLRQLVTLRPILKRKFGRMFEERIVHAGLDLPGDWKKVGRLAPTQMQVTHGWLTLAWLAPKSSAPVAKVAGSSSKPAVAAR